MLRFIYFIRHYFLLIVILPTIFLGCRKEIDFDVTDTIESENLHPLQQYYEPWETVPVSTNGTPFMIEADNNYLYIVSDDGSKHWVEYMSGNHFVSTIFFSQDYKFTALTKGVNRMIIGGRGGTNCVSSFNYNGIINTYAFYVPSSRRINAFYDDAISFYVGGSFLSFGSAPASSYADRIYSNNGNVPGTDGIISYVYEMKRVDFSPYACGKSILPTGHSIAEWTGSIWEPRTPIIDDKITDIEQIGDTLFIATFDSNGSAIKKFSNGNLITDSTIVSTVPAYSSRVKLLSHNNSLYAYGTINVPEGPYQGVLKYTNGEWSYVGKLGGIPKDLTIFNGYLYAIINGQIKRFPL